MIIIHFVIALGYLLSICFLVKVDIENGSEVTSLLINKLVIVVKQNNYDSCNDVVLLWQPPGRVAEKILSDLNG